MTLYRQPGSRLWWMSIYPGGGKQRIRKSTGTADRGEAEMVEAAMRRAVCGSISKARLAELLAAVFQEDEDGQPHVSLTDAWQRFVDLPEVELAPETIRKMRVSWRRFVRWTEDFWPSVANLDDVTPEVAYSFADWLRDEVNKRKTYNNNKNDVKTVFQRLLHRAGMSGNPFANVPNLRTTDSLHGRAFTREEETRILAYVAGKEWEGICLVGLYTGLRLGDISRLRWSCVRESELRIVPSKTGRHGITVVMPLHDRVRAWLLSWPQTSEYVFPIRESRHGMSNYADDFSRILLAAGVTQDGDEYLSFHCWRHTFRTRLAEKGVAKEIAQKLGGWTTDLSELYNHDMAGLHRAIKSLD